MITDPAHARPRPDLTFLSTRSSRALVPAPPAPPVAPTPVAPAPVVPPASSLDLDAAPAPHPAPTAPTPTVSAVPSSLDLDDHGHDTPSAAPMSSPASAAPAAAPAPVVERPRGTRLPASGRLILTPAAPAVTLSRVASGVGALSVEAAISSDVGDVRFGCAYELASGPTSFFNPDGGARSAPPGARLPLVVAGRERFARLSIDLRQVQDLQRALFVVHSGSQAPLSWAGTLLVTTHAGAQISVPLDPAPAGVALAAVSLYQVSGEIVVRAELDASASVREACLAFGYDAITWLDDSFPIA